MIAMPFLPELGINRRKTASGAHNETCPPPHIIHTSTTEGNGLHGESQRSAEFCLGADPKRPYFSLYLCLADCIIPEVEQCALGERDGVRYFFEMPSIRPVAAALVNFCPGRPDPPGRPAGSGYAAKSEESQGVKSGKGAGGTPQVTSAK